ncbi:MAG: ribonuclease III [bacterium]
MFAEILNNIIERFFSPRKNFHPPSAEVLAVIAAQAKPFDFYRYQRTIGYQPKDWKLFIESLIHRSYLQYITGDWRSNERLEYLGDAVLNFLVAEYVYSLLPVREEGEMTKIRSRLVNRRVLAQRARELQLHEFLLLSSSALQSIEGGSESILADAYEATIGAICVDGGMERAQSFVNRTILSNQSTMAVALLDDNYKSTLLEYAQAHTLGIPRYTVLREEGPDHDRRFTVEVFIGTDSLGTGTGRSKKDAEQAAAAQALDKINNHSTP